MMHEPVDNAFWDDCSDQPYRLSRPQKRRFAGLALREYLFTGATAVLASPFLMWRYLMPDVTTVRPEPKSFVGLSVSPDPQYNDEILAMVEELGVAELLVRVPTWGLDRIDDYLRFVEQFGGRRVLINILQNRDSVLKPREWTRNLDLIFDRFRRLTPLFQIGNASNRSKWGCLHSGEYLCLLERAAKVRDKYPGIKLIGPSAIDFEPLFALRTLLNARDYHLDAASSLLYVNRRGSPLGKQLGVFDLKRKLRLLHAIAGVSNRSDRRLWITEFNWPLLDTKPYTPNSGRPETTIDEATQAAYLKQYYRIAYGSGLVEKAYWWQLVAPGYGLVDSRGGRLRKRPSYYAFKEVVNDLGKEAGACS